MKIECIAIDDEPLALDIIKSYSGKLPFLNLIECFTNPLESLELINQKKIDLLFLDIQMDDMNGIQFLNIVNYKPLVIFTTAYDKYAVKGYELDIVDYLLKPIPFDRFVAATEKVVNRLQTKNETNIFNDNLQRTNYCFIKTEHKLKKVFFDDILYIEGMSDYLKIVTKNQNILTLNNFKKMEEILPSHNFCRIHKSYMVALDKIINIEKNQIRLSDLTIPISDKYKANLFEKLNRVLI